MPKPVNYPISPDAPDSENPDLSVKLKVGPPRMKAPKPKAKGITKPDPQDAGVFTQEKLKQFGGTMKDIPQGMDGAMKKGGSVKRYADGGDVAEYDERISKERDKVDRNNKLVNPYLREDANAANKRIETNVSDLRKKRQEAAGVGAGRGEKNPPKAFAAGGFVRAADGCAQRGKTKGMMR